MVAKLITYDLNSPGQDYAKLHEEIKKLGDWWHFLDSTWLVDTPLTVNQIVDRLRERIDKNDHLLVIDVTRDPHQGWLPQAAWNWINEHMMR